MALMHYVLHSNIYYPVNQRLSLNVIPEVNTHVDIIFTSLLFFSFICANNLF